MLVELEGVKLDVTITEKDIRDNKHSIKNVEDCLDKVVGKLNIINQQFDVFRAEFQLLKNQHTIQYSPKAVEYSNLDNQNASGLQKRHEENNNIIGSNLNDDIVMSRNDALQSLANLRSECLSNVCYDTQLKRLDNSELVQTLFRHDVIDLSNITMRNRKQSKQSLEKLIPIVPYNDMENKACDPAGEVSTDYELPLIVNDQHLNISTQNSTLIRHETKESGSRTNPIQKEQSCHYNVPGRQSCSSYLHDRGQQFQSIPVRITHRPLPVNPEKVNKHRRAYRSQVFRHRHQTDWLRYLELVRKITRSQTVSILT